MEMRELVKYKKKERFMKRRVVFHQKNNVKAAQQNYIDR